MKELFFACIITLIPATAFAQSSDLKVKDGELIKWSDKSAAIEVDQRIDSEHTRMKVEFDKPGPASMSTGSSALGWDGSTVTGSAKFVLKGDIFELNRRIRGRQNVMGNIKRHNNILVRDGTVDGLPQVRMATVKDVAKAHPGTIKLFDKKDEFMFALLLRKERSKVVIHDPINDRISMIALSKMNKDTQVEIRKWDKAKADLTDKQKELLERWDNKTDRWDLHK